MSRWQMQRDFLGHSLGGGLKDLRDWEWFGFNGEVARFSEAEAMARYSGYEPEGATLRAII